MAKDLPYFKFVISEWNDGDVTLCSFEAQGLFINLCSVYWSQEGNLSIAKAKRRFSNCNATAWDELFNENIIKVDGDDIVINFLDEQFNERGKQSDTNAENARKGWQKRKKNATVMRPHSDSTNLACNIEEKREEERRKEERISIPSNGFGYEYYEHPEQAFTEVRDDTKFVESLLRIARGSGYVTTTDIQLMTAVRYFLITEGAKPDFDRRPRDEIKKHLVNWISKNAKKLTEYGQRN